MKDPIRRAVAYIAARVCSQQEFVSLHDQQTNQNYSFRCEQRGVNISVYDQSEGCRITGTCNEGMFTLHHSGADQSLTCTVRDRDFKGYDYATGHSYSGNVSVHTVTIYDNDTNRYYSYLF